MGLSVGGGGGGGGGGGLPAAGDVIVNPGDADANIVNRLSGQAATIGGIAQKAVLGPVGADLGLKMANGTYFRVYTNTQLIGQFTNVTGDESFPSAGVGSRYTFYFAKNDGQPEVVMRTGSDAPTAGDEADGSMYLREAGAASAAYVLVDGTYKQLAFVP